MEKLFHYDITYYLAHKLGYAPDICQKIAWANYRTDKQTKAVVSGIQTQSSPWGFNWADPQIQLTVIIAFHFASAYVANSDLVQKVVQAAVDSKDIFRLGVALHLLQDSYSHKGFSGWDESLNACYPKLSFKRSFWMNVKSLFGRPIPNIGHAEMGTIPDEISTMWKDPRTGEVITNRFRAAQAAKVTQDVLLRFNKQLTPFVGLSRLWDILRLPNYETRKRALCKESGCPAYSQITKQMQEQYGDDFNSAARKHLAVVMENL